MLIAVNHLHLLTIDCPGNCVLVESHVYLGSSDHHFGFVSIEPELVLFGIMTNDVKCPLESTGTVREKVGVICHTNSSGAQRSQVEAKLGAVQGQETGFNVNFKVSAGSNMALSVAFVLLHFPAQFVLHFQMTVSVLIGVSAVVQQVDPFTNGVQLPPFGSPSLLMGKQPRHLKILQSK